MGVVYAGEENMSKDDGNTGEKTYIVDRSGAAKADDLSIVRS